MCTAKWSGRSWLETRPSGCRSSFRDSTRLVGRVAELTLLGGTTRTAEMRTKKFKTDKRLWMWTSLALFTPPWLFWPVVSDYALQHKYSPAGLFLLLFTTDTNVADTLYHLVFFTVVIAVPALAFGWLLHTPMVMLREARRQRHDHAA